MAEGRSVQSSGDIGFAGLLTVLFIGLKLTGYITWSWWWVLAPLWLPITVVLGVILVALVGYVAVVATVAVVGALGQWAMRLGRR